jgi:hypothetical protein
VKSKCDRRWLRGGGCGGGGEVGDGGRAFILADYDVVISGY